MNKLRLLGAVCALLIFPINAIASPLILDNYGDGPLQLSFTQDAGNAWITRIGVGSIGVAIDSFGTYGQILADGNLKWAIFLAEPPYTRLFVSNAVGVSATTVPIWHISPVFNFTLEANTDYYLGVFSDQQFTYYYEGQPSISVNGLTSSAGVVGDNGLGSNFNDPVAEAGGVVQVSMQIYGSGFIPPTKVDLSGKIKTPDDTDICAMVLASGQFMFSCNPVGIFSLTDLPREQNGMVKRQIYADGFFPKIDILTESSVDAVVMTRSGTCPNYNTPYDPGVFPDSAGKRINISGRVLLQNSQTPICAMALANGQYMFTCDGTGNYALNIPLDTNGQFKLQVYADGFAPITQKFDEFSNNNDVRMARAVECQ